MGTILAWDGLHTWVSINLLLCHVVFILIKETLLSHVLYCWLLNVPKILHAYSILSIFRGLWIFHRLVSMQLHIPHPMCKIQAFHMVWFTLGKTPPSGGPVCETNGQLEELGQYSNHPNEWLAYFMARLLIKRALQNAWFPCDNVQYPHMWPPGNWCWKSVCDTVESLYIFKPTFCIFSFTLSR